VAIARALAAEPEIVLYDEANHHVDSIIPARPRDLSEDFSKLSSGQDPALWYPDMRFAERLARLVLSCIRAGLNISARWRDS